jgi:hypothetical protein
MATRKNVYPTALLHVEGEITLKKFPTRKQRDEKANKVAIFYWGNDERYASAPKELGDPRLGPYRAMQREIPGLPDNADPNDYYQGRQHALRGQCSKILILKPARLMRTTTPAMSLTMSPITTRRTRTRISVSRHGGARASRQPSCARFRPDPRLNGGGLLLSTACVYVLCG